jgi:hypothetical protein
MNKSTRVKIATVLLVVLFCSNVSHAFHDDFNSVVKMIEQFYKVKHEGLPFIAKAAMKAVGVGAKIRGGEYKRFADAGSIKLAMFEDQEFSGDFMKFRSSLNSTLKETWTPLVQTISGADGEQSYVFVRENGNKFIVLIIAIEQRDGTVIQATLSPRSLALLMKDPEEGGKSIRQEATIADNE